MRFLIIIVLAALLTGCTMEQLKVRRLDTGTIHLKTVSRGYSIGDTIVLDYSSYGAIHAVVIEKVIEHRCN